MTGGRVVGSDGRSSSREGPDDVELGPIGRPRSLFPAVLAVLWGVLAVVGVISHDTPWSVGLKVVLFVGWAGLWWRGRCPRLRGSRHGELLVQHARRAQRIPRAELAGVEITAAGGSKGLDLLLHDGTTVALRGTALRILEAAEQRDRVRHWAGLAS